MTAPSEVTASFKAPVESSFSFGIWQIHAAKGHIMDKSQEERYQKELRLPHLPDMVFSSNHIRLGTPGFTIEFNPLDALKTVNDHEDLVHVSLSKAWKEARKDSPHINKIIHPYDWTYTPFGYKGSLSSGESGTFTVSSTQDRINYEKLKEKEKILFYEEVILYEDELDDNGCAVLSAKIRVMPSGFFCLQRFYLRVDRTLIRVIDTRLYYETGKPYLLREYAEKEAMMEELTVPQAVWMDRNKICSHLKLKSEMTEKVEFNTKTS